MKDYAVSAVEEIDRLFNRHECVEPLLTGINTLDQRLGGFRKGEVTLLAAPPSVGKSALALSVVNHLAIKENVPTVYFSADLDGIQISLRLMSLASNVNLNDLRCGNLAPNDWPALTMAANQLSQAPIFIHEFKRITTERLVDLVSLQRDLKLLVIDDFHFINFSNEAQEKDDPVAVLAELKRLAQTRNIAVLVLSRLETNINNDASTPPLVSDLGWGNDVEQAADVILFLLGDAYHDHALKPSETKLYIAKQSNGPTVPVELAFDARYSRFYDLQQVDC